MTRTAQRDFPAEFSTAMYRRTDGQYKWGGGDEHLPVGVGAAGNTFRAHIRFALDWTGIAKITSAQLIFTISPKLHLDDRDGNITVYVGYDGAAPPENNAYGTVCGGGGFLAGTWDSYANTDSTYIAGTMQSYWSYGVNVINALGEQAPASVQRADGSPGGGRANTGITISDEGKQFEIWSYRAGVRTGSTAYRPIIRVNYELANEAPYTPSITTASGTITADTTPDISAWAPGDIDGDTLTEAILEYGVAGGNGSGPTYGSTVGMGISGGGAGAGATLTASPSITPGSWISYRCRVKDEHGAWSAYSATRYIYVNRAPSVSVTPGVLAITNLAEVAEWTSGGAHAKPRVRLTVSDPDGDYLNAYRLIIRSSAGGTAVYDSGEVGCWWASGAVVDLSPNVGLINGTSYYVTAYVRDTVGQWSAVSAEQTVRVRWSQAIYQANPGAGSGSYSFASGPVSGSSSSVVFLYRSATGAAGAGAGAWRGSIGEVDGSTWVNILVRLAIGTDTGTPTALGAMTFGYLGTAQGADQWTFVGFDSTSWALANDVRRYGTRSMRFQRETASPTPTWTIGRTTNGDVYDTVPVVAGETYTVSCWVKATLSDGSFRVEVVGNDIIFAATENVDDTSAYLDGWRRIQKTFIVPLGVTSLEVRLTYVATSDGVGDTLWVDAVQVEEGPVASIWSPGRAGAVVMDVGGIAVDASKGASFRLRGVAGGARDNIELGSNGLVFGGDVNVYSGTAGVLTVSGTLNTPQITFPATQVASSNANTLDDYEEGGWTPSLSWGGASTGWTWEITAAGYTVIGRMVFGHVGLHMSGKGSSAGAFQISGLPFTCVGIGSTAIAWAANFTGLVNTIVGGLASGTAMSFYDGSEDAAITDARFSGNEWLYFTFMYPRAT